LLALTLHACITAFICWRARIFFWSLEHRTWETIVGFQFLNSSLAFYLLGDFDYELLSCVRYKFTYLFIALIWYIYLFVFYFILTTLYYTTLATVDQSLIYTNLMQDILKYFIMRRTSENYKAFLKKQWYIQNFPGNTWRKKKFNFFLKFTSIILIIIHVFLWLFLFYLCYFFIHYWLTSFFLILERNWLYYLLSYLKILFIYNFYISMFFDRTSVVWIWLFIAPAQTTEEVSLLIFSDYTEEDIIQAEMDEDHVFATDAVIFPRLAYSQMNQRYWRSKFVRKSYYSLALFNNRDKEIWRYIMPKQWHSWRKKEYGCLIKNNHFYTYKIFLRSLYQLFTYDTWYIAIACSIYFFKKLPDLREWMWTNSMSIDRFYISSNRNFRKKNTKIFKKYKFK